MKHSIQCKSPSELGTIADILLEAYPHGRIFTFYGAMGAGKTTLIKALCNRLNVIDTVTSPTFALVNVYLTAGNRSVYHFDLYRMKKLEEIFDIGYEDYFYSGSYCLIEWPELIEQLLPESCIRVKIDVAIENEIRTITF